MPNQPQNPLNAGPSPMMLVDADGNALGTLANPLVQKISGQNLDGTNVKTYTDGTTAGPAIPIEINIAVPDGATGNIDTVYQGPKFEITKAWLQKRSANSGANANTIQILKAAAAITEALSINGTNDTVVKDFAQIDDANSTISPGDTIRITRTKAGGDVACLVTIHGVARA